MDDDDDDDEEEERSSETSPEQENDVVVASLRSGELQQLRESTGLSLPKIAKMFRVSVRTWGLWESGRERPDSEVLMQLQALLKAQVRLRTSLKKQSPPRID